MKKSGAVIIFVFFLVLVSGSTHEVFCQEKKAPPPWAPTDKDPRAYLGLTDKNIEALQRGEVVILKTPEDLIGKRMVVAAIIMNQDIDTTWNLLTQPWRQAEYQAGLEKSELVEKLDDGSVVDFHIRIMTVNIKYRMIHTNKKSDYSISWKLDPEYENDMKDAMGFFRLYWVDESHTLVRYGTVAQSKFLIAPKVQVFILKQSIPDAFGSVKKWVDSGGTYRKKRYEPAPE